MSKRAKTRAFKVGDRVMMVGTVTAKDSHIYWVKIDGDHGGEYSLWHQALHPHTVRATAEGKPEKKQQPTKGAKKK